MWSSDGSGSFTVAPVETAPRGSSIVLHLKDDALEFLEDWKIESVVRTYSDHIAHPIMLSIGSETARQVNSANAIWTRPKSGITPEQHKEFFGHISGSYSDPTITLHYRAEGRHEYTVLLYVPGERPFDLYDPDRRGRQKLYVKRVYIADDVELLPPYLRFVRGVIDSEDMPLNISREMLQNNPQVAAIRKAVTNKVVSELKKVAESDEAAFRKVWDVFGPVLKEGLYEDMERRDQLYELVRFKTTAGDFVSLKDYAGRLQENQTAIYYITAEDEAKARSSPQLEGYRARGIEVLLLTDAIDSFWVRTALGFDGKPFKSVTQGAADLDLVKRKDETTAETADDAATAVLVAALKQALGEKVKDVRSSKRLTESAVCIVNDSEMDRTLEKLLSRQKDSSITVSAPILEINPSHALIKALGQQVQAKGASAVEDAAQLLLDQAFIIEGEQVPDPAAFARRLADVMAKALG
jgi:molecular chaperone HtpG